MSDTTRDTSFAVISLQNLMKYYWRVMAYNAAGGGSFTTTDSFTTIISIPLTPTLASTALRTGVARRPTYTWNPSTYATKYRLQIASDSTFASVVVDTTLPDTSVQISDTLEVKTTYFWHVGAIDTAGISPYPAPVRFITGEGILGIDMPGGIPRVYALMQNYPNPFNPTTTIGYDLPNAGHVTLEIYDILGREVATLVDESQHAGLYSVRFDGSRYASGVYFYRILAISADGRKFISLKKMLLLK